MLSARAWLLLLAAATIPSTGRADHVCDASIAQEEWKMIASHEMVGVKDGVPYQSGSDWFVDRTTTVLPLCNYINAVGNYSLRSYSLSPEDRTERVVICKGTAPVGPYAGSCPPR
jgi:hypothetical protein